MYSNQQPSIYATLPYLHDSQLNSRNNSGLLIDPSRSDSYYPNNQPSISGTYFNDRSNFTQQQSPTINYVPPNTNRISNHIRSHSSGSSAGGRIEKTNMMSNENPFCDPARPYEQLNSARTKTSITSCPKSGGSVNKSLNLSDENPFHAIYGNYLYPSQINPAKRITNQTTTIRSTDNKSLSLSDENPFHSTYGRYHYPSQIDPQRRITEISKSTVPLIPINDISNDNPFTNYRPSPIREYSIGGQVNSFSTSISDWTRNNPAPLSYRPIQVQRPSQEYYNQKESLSLSSYNPPVSPPRQQREPSSAPLPLARIESQKPNSLGPLEKTSLNMSSDNPFAQTYGRYHYPSSAEIKAQKRDNERNTHFTEQPQPVIDNRLAQLSNQMTEYSQTEKKETISGKGATKFTRFDVDF